MTTGKLRVSLGLGVTLMSNGSLRDWALWVLKKPAVHTISVEKSCVSLLSRLREHYGPQAIHKAKMKTSVSIVLAILALGSQTLADLLNCGKARYDPTQVSSFTAPSRCATRES
jgi:hypothetical protein